ncbi:hypothetical protein PF005_g14519 [Phytophthora fragariae]|uniref:Uncharacterized protein n=2 Tax=Phytophthora fragariae TaxID=53985 RepID=A0A6A3F615_9STRA|nr:hypothetical protein PF009_g10063 [Phytophthora fragariae]KAE9145748.1 hypothetical protein PF006_g9432 [Phytophthora fragariae]KAE9202563.1 hypothetical protein PF005_g14519 [Phytophthora fragariae]KAE9312155.1 hypothetical protein PF001_g9373 [Phytophthora fragariae]
MLLRPSLSIIVITAKQVFGLLMSISQNRDALDGRFPKQGPLQKGAHITVGHSLAQEPVCGSTSKPVVSGPRGWKRSSSATRSRPNTSGCIVSLSCCSSAALSSLRGSAMGHTGDQLDADKLDTKEL